MKLKIKSTVQVLALLPIVALAQACPLFDEEKKEEDPAAATAPLCPAATSAPVSASASTATELSSLALADAAKCPTPIVVAQPVGAGGGDVQVVTLPPDEDEEDEDVDPSTAPDPVAAPGSFAIANASGAAAPTNPEITWSAAGGADHYELAVSANADCSQALDTKTDLKELKYTSAVSADGTYHVCLKAVNAGGETMASNSGAFTFVRMQLPVAFSITNSSGGPSQTVPSINWNASGGATHYLLTLAPAPNCSSPVYTSSPLTSTSHTPSVDSDGTYYACVVAVNAAGELGASNSGTFSFTRDTTGPDVLASFTSPANHKLGALTIAFQAATSHGDYDHMTLRLGAAGSVPADCASGTEIVNFTSFSGSVVQQELSSDPNTSFSVRACLYDALGNVTSPAAMTIATITTSTDRRAFVTSAAFNGNLKANYNSQTFSNGYDGADYRCQKLADDASLGGSWKAILGGEGARDPYVWTSVTGKVYNLQGEKVADDKSELLSTSSSLENAIDVTEAGAIISSGFAAWTGFYEGSTNTSGSYYNCDDWTSSASWGAYGDTGDPRDLTGDWVNASSSTCNTTARLYCIERQSRPTAPTVSAVENGGAGNVQVTVDFPASTTNYGQVKLFRTKGNGAFANPNCSSSIAGATLLKTYDGSTVTFTDDVVNDTTGAHGWFSYAACLYRAGDSTVVVDVATGSVLTGMTYQRVFVTPASFTGNLGGLAGANATCASQASGASLTGTWKAMIGDSSTLASANVAINGPVYDLAGNFIAANSTDLWEPSIGLRGVRALKTGAEFFDIYDDGFWTGSTWAFPSNALEADDTCSDWTSSSSSEFGSNGTVRKNGYSWFGFAGNDCDDMMRLLCVDGQ